MNGCFLQSGTIHLVLTLLILKIVYLRLPIIYATVINGVTHECFAFVPKESKLNESIG